MVGLDIAAYQCARVVPYYGSTSGEFLWNFLQTVLPKSEFTEKVRKCDLLSTHSTHEDSISHHIPLLRFQLYQHRKEPLPILLRIMFLSLTIFG